MAYLGNAPTAVPLGSADLADNIITSAKIVDGTVTAGDLNATLNLGSKTVTLPATSVTDHVVATDLTATRQGIATLGLQMADIKGVALNFNDGVADAYDTDSLATSTNAVYDATTDLYSGGGTSSQILQGAGTAFGNMTGNGGLAAGFDSGGDTRGTSASFGGTGAYIGKDLGAGNEAIIIGCEWDNPTDADSVGAGLDLDINLYASNSSPANATDGTLLGAVGTEADGSPGGITTSKLDFSNTTAYRYVWASTIVVGGSATTYCGEVRFYSAAATVNITLINTAYTADAIPATAFVTIQAEPTDAITVNTDLTAEVSRDGGSTYTTVTLVAGAVNAGFVNYEGSVTLTSTSGTSMVLRTKTLNLKAMQVSGHVLRWSS